MSAYYKISYGTGTAWLASKTIKVDEPTTDMCALTDILIDALVDEKSSNILDMDNEYEWSEDGETIHRVDDPSWVIYPDTFIVGGNCGDVFIHHGELLFEDVTKELEDTYGEILFS